MSKSANPIIDFHMHPGPAWLPTERRLHLNSKIDELFKKLIRDMDEAGIDLAVTMLLDDDWFDSEAGIRLMQLYNELGWGRRLILCAMFDVFRTFETDIVFERIRNAAALGVRGIKVHPVLQRITNHDFPVLLSLSHEAESLGMFVIIHSFNDNIHSSTNIGLDIASHIVTEINTPIIIAHAGGIDFSRTVYLAKQYPQIMIDLSFFFELNSILDLDNLLKWGLCTLGPDRFLFGSDHPSCPVITYKKTVTDSLTRIGASDSDIAKIMGGNAKRILGITL